MKGIKRFVKKVLESEEFEGCWYKALDDKGLYLVFAYDEDAGLCCKIAKNADSLQCDYDCDWEILHVNDYYPEWVDILHSSLSGNDLCKEIAEAYKEVK